MRVKRLEIQGFKSFKDKTVIHFDHSITGIVGPNGCGKSNIVDAFFWVMGEQSYKHMRGSSSEDLIFNGSSKYSPLGMAEATMVLETDVDAENAPAGATTQDVPVQLKTKEISVTRRLYRSGEGEYFINGTTARLKDIHELFMDTGVGTKGYSVIEQGQIGKIVNSKPEDRRLLIEDAAGIAKYKARKKESLRKMEATQANLSRLTDIIQEIEKNLDSLERQAQKARLYKKYKDELFDKEMTWGRRKKVLLSEKIEVFRQRKEVLEQELAGLRAELQTSENSVEVDRISLVTLTQDGETLQSDIQSLSNQLAQEKSSLDLSRRRQGDLAAQLSSLTTEKQELETTIEADSARLASGQTESESATLSAQEMSRQAQSLLDEIRQARQEIDQVRSQYDSRQNDLRKSTAEKSRLTAEIATLQGAANAAKTHMERLQNEVMVQEARVDQMIQELENIQESKTEIKTRREEIFQQKKTIDQTRTAQEQAVRAVEAKLAQAVHTFTQVKSKLQSLEELDASYEGMTEGTRSVLEWAKLNQKDIRALTDAIQVKSGYESVFQSWFEDRLENMVTSDASLALEQIAQARTEKKGRVRFQLTNSNAKTSTPENATDFPEVKDILTNAGFEVCGPLKDYLNIPEELSEICGPFVNRVCVVKSSEPFNAFFNQKSQLNGWAVVSQDGVVLEPSQVLRGGESDKSGMLAILRRKRQIEELKQESATAEALVAQIQGEATAAEDELSSILAQLDSIQSEGQTLEIQMAALDRDIHQTEKAVQDAENGVNRLKRELTDVQAQEAKARTNCAAFETQIEQLSARVAEIEGTLEASQSSLHEKEAFLKEKESKHQEIRIQEASLHERANSLKREMDGTRSILSDRSRRLSEIQRTLERATQERSQFSGGEAELAQKIEELTVKLGGSRERLSEVKDRIEQINAAVNTAHDRMKEIHKSVEVKSNETNQLALDAEKLSGEMSHLILNLEEKYGVGCLDQPPAQEQQELGEPVVTREISHEEEIELGEQVETLRERIRRLGEVNTMAIEEFEQLKKRHDHLQTEKLDLEKSLVNLEKAIEHINQTSEERFRKAFEAIADRFERLFPIIFGGGQAKLSLVYPEGSSDILDAGIDIMAQPPGKKVVNITLLSGGEKALTAVSLIFAIFMVKPSPFCVLDEVDAPLDDANIGKFNALLREMSARSQFILITHNKKTMELNDTLYGVTMEEPGVSKMVSIEMH